METAIYYYLIISSCIGTYAIVRAVVTYIATNVLRRKNQQVTAKPVTESTIITNQVDKKYKVNKKAIENYVKQRYWHKQSTEGLHNLTTKYHRK